MSEKDQIYAEQKKSIEAFAFDESVTRVFNDMITRSVPGYASIVQMIGVLSEDVVQAGTRCYDLGCSLGVVTHAIRQYLNRQERDCTVIALDKSPAMVAQCQELLTKQDSDVPYTVSCGDVCDCVIDMASVVVLNFVLQFIPIEQRAALLQRIYDGLVPGGALVLSEKITFSDSAEDAFQVEMHHAFKRLNGYSDLEISQKRTALENVLIPETLAVHRERLQSVGFSSVYVWFQCFNFCSIVAVKT